MKNFKMLSKAEMRKVAGGNYVQCPEGLCYNLQLMVCDWPSNGNCADDEYGTCTVTVTCNAKNTISCTGSGGACKSEADGTFSAGWVQCDKDAKVYCAR